MTDPNEPAYPVTIPEGHIYVHDMPSSGLTKREEFAKAAMTAIGNYFIDKGHMDYKYTAEMSVKMADALILELNKPVTP